MSGTYGYRDVFNESVSAVTATNTVALGTRRLEGGNEYIYTYNAATTAAIGYGVITSCNSGYSVVVSTAAGSRPLGIVQNEALITNNYGWVLTKGYAHVLCDDGVSAGDVLTMDTNGSWSTSDASSIGTWGQVTTSIASGGTGLAYVNCVG